MSFTLFPSTISDSDKQLLARKALKCRGDILTMTTLASSGHPGGSMSSIDILTALYHYANIRPENFRSPGRDRVVVSIGHISPAVYSVLAEYGFFSADKAISEFRKAGSIFEGHIERTVPGIEWTTGNLGQGVSGACGMAYAAKLLGEDSFVYTLTGDGEHQKGQIAEARRFAVKFNLSNLIVFLDSNGLQISGKTGDVMPQNIAAEYEADGWAVFHCSGHDYKDIVTTVHAAQKAGRPSLIIAATVMGKGVSFMEDKHGFHGSALGAEDYVTAMQELGLEPQLEKYKELRKAFRLDLKEHALSTYEIRLDKLPAKPYPADASTDCRSAAGAAMTEIVARSLETQGTPVVVFDCDLAGSIKTTSIEKNYPERFVQCGISEHHAASCSGAASVQGIIPFFTGFTMFAVDEVYNQLRMNDINGTNLKVLSTHAGVDVGEDGRTHQCIDYLGLMRNLFGFQVIAPADPNQTDKVVKYAAGFYGNVHIVMGRSKVPVITDDSGKPYFGEGYEFQYGKIDLIREGKYPLVSYGVMLYRALKVRDILGDMVGVYNVSTPVETDGDEVAKLAKAGVIFVLEDHNPRSGLYATICEIVASRGLPCRVVPFGIENYTYSGSPDEIYKLIGIDPESVAAKIKEAI